MRDSGRRGNFSEAEVAARLREAGLVLVALPWAGCFPCGFRSLWPASEVTRPGRRRPPTSYQIDAMDQAYGWTAFIVDQDERRLVLMRSLMLAPSPSGKDRHVWTWGRLRRATGLHPDTLKRRWGRGIGHMVAGLNAIASPAHRAKSAMPSVKEMGGGAVTNATGAKRGQARTVAPPAIR